MSIIKVTYEIEVTDESLFRQFYIGLGDVAAYDGETTAIGRLIEDFIVCQDMYREKTQQTFVLEKIGLDLVDSYSYLDKALVT